jgi:hypothetical protein
MGVLWNKVNIAIPLRPCVLDVGSGCRSTVDSLDTARNMVLRVVTSLDIGARRDRLAILATSGIGIMVLTVLRKIA